MRTFVKFISAASEKRKRDRFNELRSVWLGTLRISWNCSSAYSIMNVLVCCDRSIYLSFRPCEYRYSLRLHYTLIDHLLLAYVSDSRNRAGRCILYLPGPPPPHHTTVGNYRCVFGRCIFHMCCCCCGRECACFWYCISFHNDTNHRTWPSRYVAVVCSACYFKCT